MLQRAASSAYSWWWASHIRTKQSKWLEQSLQDMEEKVGYVLKLIEEDGDSFAKRAEMYYKKRPELINFVEESYRSFRALAERYDHLSTELQNANNRIATVFPEEVQFTMDDEDEYSPRVSKNFPQASAPNAPKVPNKDLKGLLTTATKKLQGKKSSESVDVKNNIAKSGLSKSDALEEIEKLQKDILTLQTVKEFVKSSYESGLAKYWGIENQIMEMQQKVCSLQDEFGMGKAIEDNEARTLMAGATLESCQDTLVQLLEKQEICTKEARDEYKRIEDACERLKSLRDEFLLDQTHKENLDDKEEFAKLGEKSQNQKVDGVTQKTHELEVLQEKIKEYFEVGLGSLTVTELADKIDELVNKVISLESAVSFQTSLINRLRTETGDLQAQIQNLEDDKATLIDGTHNLGNRLSEMEEKLQGIQDLNQDVENQHNHLQTHFIEARCSLDNLSEKLYNMKLDEDIEATSPLEEDGSLDEVKLQEESEKQKNIPSPSDGFGNSNTLKTGEDKKEQDLSAPVKNQRENKETDHISEKCMDPKPDDAIDKQDLFQIEDNPVKSETQEAETEKEDETFCQQMFLRSCLEDRENMLLTEYTTILMNYKEVKKKLSEIETKNRDSLFEMTMQLRELRSVIAKRDGEIQLLNVEQERLRGNDDVKEAHWSASDILNNRSVKPEGRTDDSAVKEYRDILSLKKEEEDIKLILMDQHQTLSPIEEKLRMNIDAILDENLDFWLRFSTAFHQVQKFRTSVQDLQAEISRLKDKKKQEDINTNLKSDARPIYKHLREIQTELLVWLEQSTLLKDELQRRFSSFCNIQEEIMVALKEGVASEEIKFNSHQAAKFQGEVLNMKQENNKVREELQEGFDHVTALQFEIGKTLVKLDDEFELCGAKNHNQPQLGHSVSRSRIPLRSFLFGNKPKKQKHSIFSCMHRYRNYGDLRARLPT